jgi:hypothetical protein
MGFTYVKTLAESQSAEFSLTLFQPSAVALTMWWLRLDVWMNGIKTLFTMIAHRVGSVTGACHGAC